MKISLKLKYTLFILIIHLVLAGLVFYILREQKLYFFLAEIGIILSLGIAYGLFRDIIRPLEFMSEGKNAIVDKDFNIKYVETGSTEMDKLIVVYNDMIDNIRVERTQVQEQHYFLKKLINASPNGIIILDYDDRIAELNPKAMDLLQIKSNWQNQPLSKFDHPILKEIQQLPINTSKVITLQGIESYKCQASTFIHQGFKRKFILIQELSKEILAAEKRAYGKVIRMMAHEVNNSIGAINSILHSVVEIETENEAEEDVINALSVAIDRNDKLNLFMRNFAEVVRIPAPNFEKIDLNKLLKNVATLMEAQAKTTSIQFQFDLKEKPVYVKADSRMMEQVLVNMVKNAIEAQKITSNQPSLIRFSTSPKGFSIADNGTGIEPNIEEKLFTPFFSTKPTGQGVGLTLIREILSNHNAIFSLKSIDENWTVFKVEFGG